MCTHLFEQPTSSPKRILNMLRISSRRLLKRAQLGRYLSNNRSISSTLSVGPRWINDKPRARLSTQRRGGAPESSSLDKKASMEADDSKRGNSSSSSNGQHSGGTGSGDNEDDSNNNNSSSSNSTSLTKNTPPSYFPRVLALPINRRPLFPGRCYVILNRIVLTLARRLLQGRRY